MMSRRKEGGRGSNSKHILSEDERRVLHRGIDRKLQDVRQDLSPLEAQGKVEGFFNNVENAGKLGSLVEGIRDTIMEYQVCAPSYSFALYLTFVLDFIAARDLRQATRYRR